MVILVIPLVTLLLSQWVFGFIFVLPSPTQHGSLLAGLRSFLTREDVSVKIITVTYLHLLFSIFTNNMPLT
jgi:hypothetical protein